MRDMGIGSWPRRRARMSPDRVALQDGEQTLTFAQVEQRALGVAHGLRARGVGRGDRVAFVGPNSLDFVDTLFATAKLGAVFVPLNTRLAPPEAAYVLGDSAPKVLVRSPACADLADSAEVTAVGVPVLPTEPDPAGSLAELRAAGGAGAAEPLDEPVDRSDLFMIQYTSGTSGRPKGVRLSHDNVTWNAVNLLVDLDLRGDEVALVVAPLFHTAALNQVLLPTFLKGGRSILRPRWNPTETLDLVHRQRVTLLFGVTTMFRSLLDEPAWPTADLSSLRSLISGGAPLPVPLLQAYLDRGLVLQQGYGLTESSPGATFLRGEDNLHRVGSAGTACFFSDVRVVDADLRDVPRGTDGEVLVQGPNVTDGYWQRPEATAETLVQDGWLRTGDIAREDADGYLYIVDRLKDMIISGGENIYPAEVEQEIYGLPGVAECVVIGVPDERWGETGRAVVVPSPGVDLTAEQILAHLDGRLARYKIPRSVVIAETLPRTGSGKLVRSQVRALYRDPGPSSGADR